MNLDSLPIAFVAFHRGLLIGSSSLIYNEIPSLPRYQHWLASIIVAPEMRGQGWGSKLVEESQKVAPRYGVKALYLYTRSHENFYARIGWKEIETIEYHGRDAIIMKYNP